MTIKEKKIKEILFQLMETNSYIPNKYVFKLLNYLKNIESDSNLEPIILDMYTSLMNQAELEKENDKQDNIDDIFGLYGINNVYDLYQYMNDNFEYGGVLAYNDKKIKLPFGPIRGVAKYNLITTYEDKNVFDFICEFYKKLNNDPQVFALLNNAYENGTINSLKEYQEVIYQVSGYVQTYLWQQRSVRELLNDQISNCYESSYLVGEFLKSKKIPYQKYIIGRYDNLYFAHMFITYTMNNKWYYFEHAWYDFKGIYEYDSKEDLEQDVFTKYIYNNNYEMASNIDFQQYFLKPIDDLSPNDKFPDYFQYFSTISSVSLKSNNYMRLNKMIDLVYDEIILPGISIIHDQHILYKDILLPDRKEFYDIELWKKKVFHILRKQVFKLTFQKNNDLKKVYRLLNEQIICYVINSDDTYQKDIVSNIYDMDDFKIYLHKYNTNKIKILLMFSMFLSGCNDLSQYASYFASNLSKNTINKLKSDQYNHNYIISLCGDIYVDSSHINKGNRFQSIFEITNELYLLNQALILLIRHDYYYDLVNTFIDYFVYMIDIDMACEILNYQEQIMRNDIVDQLLIRLKNKKE